MRKSNQQKIKVLKSENVALKQKLVVWSDNCIGQNKNRIILFLFIYLVANGFFEEIEHKFLLSGHSYLPCDRDFAQIEKRKKVTKNFVPADLENMIRQARHEKLSMWFLWKSMTSKTWIKQVTIC